MFSLKESSMSVEVGRILRYNLCLVRFLDRNDFPGNVSSSVILGNDIASATNLLWSERCQGMNLSNRLDGGSGIQHGSHFGDLSKQQYSPNRR